MTGRDTNTTTAPGSTGGGDQDAPRGIPEAAPFGSPSASSAIGAPAPDTRVLTRVGADRPESPTAPQAAELPPATEPLALPAGPGAAGTTTGKAKDNSGWTHPKMTSILAGAGAAATSTVVGGHLGAAGTVIGAALASIITTLALNIYENTLRNGTRRLYSAWLARRGDPKAAAAAAVAAGSAVPVATGAAEGTAKGGLPVRISRRMVVVTGLTAVLATALGLGVMVGLEHSSATPITPGTSQLAGTGHSTRTPGDTPTTTATRPSSTPTTSLGGSTTTSTKATPSTTPRPSTATSTSSATGSSSTGTTSGGGGTGSGTTGSGTTGSGSGTTSGSGTSGTTSGSGTTGTLGGTTSSTG
ncbi:hypothetical protein [Raineyella fluvialis]|uniref:Uncharacterized protein n=1 Tax=Raineyella fluvialis TaxID=2662261 RepID=A0A5Q2FC37_9ACTN|nr:hypothetical protein [Raineyella fluvialis]QGF24318.1 hypothetical protein Rai3103_12340 [Raineyella fluvialis]